MITTLVDIISAQTKLTEMIAEYEASLSTTIHIPKTSIKLNAGEHYAGLVMNDGGKSMYHLVLLAKEIKEVTWAAAMDFATEIGGSLPNLREQAILFANLQNEFQSQWYWSSESYSLNRAFAGSFVHGKRDAFMKNMDFRARAVQRVLVVN